MRCEQVRCRRGFRCVRLSRGEGHSVPTCVRSTDQVCRLGPEQQDIFGTRDRTRGGNKEEDDDSERSRGGDKEEEDESEQSSNEQSRGGDKEEDDESDQSSNERSRGGDKEEDDEMEEENDKTKDDDVEDESAVDESSPSPRPRPSPGNLRLPDLCTERACCPGEKCFISRPGRGQRRVAFCAPVSIVNALIIAPASVRTPSFITPIIYHHKKSTLLRDIFYILAL